MLHQPISNPSRARYRRDRSALFIEPLLPTLVEEPPFGDAWAHKIKYDGYRTLIVNNGGKGRAFTRNGHDWTDKYSRVVAYTCRLPCRSCTLDGEIIVQDDQGRSDFASLRSVIDTPSERHRLVFMAFDLLELDGYIYEPMPCGLGARHSPS
jgi:bifunctional non-homologous end joining protein LigD